ncbi:hypothetical protein GLAREA_08443 [Glarea lozoyensis ATCC 20868]|uniref:Uncharacterized protein n=1 Tax=Glarea lozoyensis (strain ATCC 20868 / MF5171) TaxID=1116229 RepID=S3CXM8_GLAL2|nr:uncharacterized protein GLAREA_08443 [Glarea lozoyensis ATCC 20868]EPE24591.1 hypothetical protein GLAREA_08443 [Glarea lozoyensis ATCC 20868]
MPETGKRPLLQKTPLSAPKPKAIGASYVQERASNSEVTVVRGKAMKLTPVEWSSQEIPKPFLDPTIIQRRIAAEKQWKQENDKNTRQQAGRGST